MKFKVIDDNGKEVTLKLIKSFCDEKTNINYIIYSELDTDEIYASRYHLEDSKYILDPILEDKEWDMIDNILASMQQGEKND